MPLSHATRRRAVVTVLVALLASLFWVAGPGIASAACPSVVSATVPSGGTVSFDCSPASFNGVSSGAQYGMVVVGTDGRVTYTHDGGSAMTDSFTARASAGGDTQFQISILQPIDIAPSTVPDAVRGRAYAQTMTADGGVAPYSFAVTAGALPSGLTINAAGVLAGTPVTSGTFNFTLTATDSTSTSGSHAYSLTVAPPTLTMAPPSLARATVGIGYSQSVTMSGGTAPYSFALISGALPPGVTLSATGLLSGTPTQAGDYVFTVEAVDSSAAYSGGPYSAQRTYTLGVSAPTIVVAPPAALPAATWGTAYAQTFTASGGNPSYTYAVTAGALPSGLTLAADGSLTGTPAQVGTFTFTITATDEFGYQGSRTYTFQVQARAPGAPTGVSAAAGTGAAGGSATVSFSAPADQGGSPITSYTATSSDGSISATSASSPVTVTGLTNGIAYTFTVTATNSAGTGASSTASAAVTPVAGQSIAFDQSGVLDVFSSTRLAATATSGLAVTYSSSDDAVCAVMPGGVLEARRPGTCVITASQSGTAAVAPAASVQQSFSVVVPGGPIAVGLAALPDATRGVPYAQSLLVGGGAAPYNASVITGALPVGLVLASDGTISGTPTGSGDSSFTVQVTDQAEQVVTKALSLHVGQPTIALGPDALPTGQVGEPFPVIALSATGGTGPYGYAVVAGALPAGLALDASGVLRGTPISAGSGSVTIRATDAFGSTGERAYPFEVWEPAPAPTPTPTRPVLATADVSTPDAGASFLVTVTGMAPGERITAVLHSTPVAITGIPAADTDGTIRFRVEIPADFPAGAHTVVITRADGSQLPPLAIRVQESAALAFTGGTLPLAGGAAGAILLTVGGVLLMGRRRRRA